MDQNSIKAAEPSQVNQNKGSDNTTNLVDTVAAQRAVSLSISPQHELQPLNRVCAAVHDLGVYFQLCTHGAPNFPWE